MLKASPLSPQDILKRAHAVGTYYGFSTLSSLTAKANSTSKAPYPENFALDTLDPAARDVASLLKHVRDAGLAPSNLQPLFLWHSNAAPGRPAPKSIVVQFHALGAERPIADAVLIRAVRSFVQDLTKSEIRLKINSMGDKETRSRYARELNQFFRRYGASLPTDCVNCAKDDVFRAAEMLRETPQHTPLPSPTDHLSEASRKHFETVLEYLESTDTSYELTPELLSRGVSWSDTCFQIEGDDRIQVWGSRYHDFAKQFFKGSIPSVGAVVRISTEGRESILPVKEKAAPRFVFVHIGDEAKRESIKMVDELRRARIPLSQSIGIESLTAQMLNVETVNPPYVLIMGRKEALDRSVIVRERASHTEKYVPLTSLIDHLRAVG